MVCHRCLSLPLLADSPQLQANTCHVSSVLLSVEMCLLRTQKLAVCVTNIQRLGSKLFLRAQVAVFKYLVLCKHKAIDEMIL